MRIALEDHGGLLKSEIKKHLEEKGVSLKIWVSVQSQWIIPILDRRR